MTPRMFALKALELIRKVYDGAQYVDGVWFHTTTEEAAAASQLDETWQNQKWGEDPEQTERLEALKKEIRAVAVLIKLTDDFI